MYRAKTLQLLVLAFAMLTLVTRQPGNLKVANAQGQLEPICHEGHIGIQQQYNHGRYIVTISNNCPNKSRECAPNNVRLICPDYRPTNYVPHNLFFQINGTITCVVIEDQILYDRIQFAYVMPDFAQFDQLQADYRCYH